MISLRIQKLLPKLWYYFSQHCKIKPLNGVLLLVNTRSTSWSSCWKNICLYYPKPDASIHHNTHHKTKIPSGFPQWFGFTWKKLYRNRRVKRQNKINDSIRILKRTRGIKISIIIALLDTKRHFQVTVFYCIYLRSRDIYLYKNIKNKYDNKRFCWFHFFLTYKSDKIKMKKRLNTTYPRVISNSILLFWNK